MIFIDENFTIELLSTTLKAVTFLVRIQKEDDVSVVTPRMGPANIFCAEVLEKNEKLKQMMRYIRLGFTFIFFKKLKIFISYDSFIEQNNK